MGGRRSVVTAVAVLVLAATACSGDNDAEPGASTPSPTTTTESPSPTPTPTPTATTEAAVDPTVVPDEITVEYLDAVMADFDRMEAQVYRRVKKTSDLQDAQAVSRYSAMLGGSLATETLSGLEQAFGIEALGSPPQPPESEVRKVLAQSEACVLFTATHDREPLLADDVQFDPPQPFYIRIVPQDPSDLNPLPWRMDFVKSLGESADPPTTCEDVERFR